VLVIAVNGNSSRSEGIKMEKKRRKTESRKRTKTQSMIVKIAFERVDHTYLGLKVTPKAEFECWKKV
jgi:hypothetical protein